MPYPRDRMTVDWDLLSAAFEAVNEESSAFFDTVTGEVLAWSDSAPSDRDDEWKKRVAETPARYAPILPPAGEVEWRWMNDFARKKVEQPSRRVRLAHALEANGAFSRFRTLIAQYPIQQELWITYRQEQMQGLISAWAAKLPVGIENPAPWA